MKKSHLIILWIIIIGGCAGAIAGGESYIGITIFCSLLFIGCSLKISTWNTERKKKNGKKDYL